MTLYFRVPKKRPRPHLLILRNLNKYGVHPIEVNSVFSKFCLLNFGNFFVKRVKIQQ